MTRQPAIQICLLLLVAGNAKPHLKTHPFDPIHGLDFPVAFLAANLLPDMSLVVKKYMLREVIDLSPWRGDIGIEIVVLLFYLRVTCNNMFMAIQTFLHRRNPRMNRPAGIWVAEQTLYLFYPCMDPVAEGDWLFGADIGSGRHVKEKQEQENKEETAS